MPYKKVLIATDNSEPSMKAAETGFQLASQLNAETAMVFVIDTAKTRGDADAGILPQDQVAKLRIEAEKWFDSLITQGQVFERFILEDKPSQGVMNTAQEWGADLIVVGTKGKTGIKRLLLGSTAENVIRQSTIPILVVPVKQ